MNYEETMKKLSTGGIESKDTSFYKNAHCKITEVKIDNGDHPAVDHPLIASQAGKGIVWVCFFMDVKFLETGEAYKHIEVANLYKSNGNLNSGESWTNDKGEIVPESLLHELKRRCSDYHEKQKSEFGDKLVFTPGLFKTMVFEIGARVIGKDKIILQTEKQKIKDKEYQEQQQQQKPDTSVSSTTAPELKKVEDDELPF